MSRSSEQSEEEILPLPLRYTQSQGQNDKGKLGQDDRKRRARNDNKKGRNGTSFVIVRHNVPKQSHPTGIATPSARNDKLA